MIAPAQLKVRIARPVAQRCANESVTSMRAFCPSQGVLSQEVRDQFQPPRAILTCGSAICLTRRCRRVRFKAVSQDQERPRPLLDSLPLPLVTMLLSSAPALAEEAATGEVSDVTKDAADIMTQNSGILGYTYGGLVVAFSPLVIYAVFYLYRQTINPKAKLQDLLFVAAFCVVVGNILSIVVFHKRLY